MSGAIFISDDLIVVLLLLMSNSNTYRLAKKIESEPAPRIGDIFGTLIKKFKCGSDDDQ